MHTVVVFDMDGTLLDTSPGIFATANHTMRTLGFPELTDAQLRKFVGPPLAACFRVACGLEEHLISRACEIYRDEYGSGTMYGAEPYEGIIEMLEELKNRGLILLVATLKLESMAQDILRKKGLIDYFTSVHGADEQGIFTKADIIRNALKAVNREVSHEVLMVGDTPHDMDGAITVGVDFLAVDWGFGYHKGEKIPLEHGVLGTIDEPHQIFSFL